jgi:septum site-determining protein MinD
VILAVAGGKGGVGKSTVAYALAAELDAVCVDADLGMADLPERRGPDLHDVLAGRASAVEAVDESGPVALLPCGRTLAGARATDPVALKKALAGVERAYGRVVVDCPAGLGRDSGAALAAAEACLLVTTRSRAATAAALRVRELARTLDAGLVGVVVNRVDERSEATHRASGSEQSERHASRESERSEATHRASGSSADRRSADHASGRTAPASSERSERHATRAVDDGGVTETARERFGAPAVAVPESAAVARATRHGLPVAEVAHGTAAARRLREVAALVQRSVSST